MLQGDTQAERVKSLYRLMKAWCKENKPASVLDDLTILMIKQPKSKPKLRCKGAECRYLIPFAVQLSSTFANKSQHWLTVHSLFVHLFDLQMMLNSEVCNADIASSLCRRLCVVSEPFE